MTNEPALERALEDIARDMATLTGVAVVAIWSGDDDTRTLSVTAVAGAEAGSLPLATLPYGIGGVGWIAARQTPLEVPDVFVDDRFVGRDWRRSHNLISFCGLPLVLDDRLFGVLALDDPAPIVLSASQRERLADLAARATSVLARSRQATEERRQQEELASARAQVAARVREMSALVAVADVVGTTTDHVEALRLICRQLSRLSGADTVAAYQLDTILDEIYPIAGYHIPPEARAALTGTRLALSDVAYAKTLFTEQRVVWSDDAPGDPRFANQFFARLPHRSCAFIPVSVDAELAGVLHLVWWTQSRRLEDHEVALLQAIGHQASVILRNARLVGLQAVTRLAIAAAHEINNPLSVVVGQLQILARKRSDVDKRRIEAALAGADQITEIVRRLTRIIRLEDIDRPATSSLPRILDLRRSSDVPPGEG